jgi:hypothetical protein
LDKELLAPSALPCSAALSDDGENPSKKKPSLMSKKPKPITGIQKMIIPIFNVIQLL